MSMIGMSFGGFLVMLIAGVIAALVMHYAANYRFLRGAEGFFGKWIAGWVGAWVGAQVIGHWWFTIAGYYAIPALIGAFAAAFGFTMVWKALAQVKAGGNAPVAQMESGHRAA